MNDILLTLQDLSKYYTTDQSVTVGLSHIDLAFRRGEFVAITGESGSGKSTLAHVMGGILRYEGGELLFGGKPTSHYDSADWERYRRDCVSFISQSYGILPGSSVLDNVTCALHLVGRTKEQAAGEAEAILKKVELWDLRRRRAAKLSSGQKQRLSIARALAKPAPILIADEPTGNLDAENSAMVISLLAEAAKDRLVILITHEFSEAEDYVTRHIELHDGRITMDAQLREVPELPRAMPRGTKAEGKKHLSWFVSRFQIKARPVWSVLMLALFAVTVFAMFAFAGTFISNLDDTFTYYYDNSAFRNGDSRRIVVARSDGGEFTQEDVNKLLSVDNVASLEEYGYLTDIQYAYREEVDYEIVNDLLTVGSGLEIDFVPIQNYSLNRLRGNMPFARTVPTLPEGQKFLTAGRLPENLYEVVAAGSEEMLGQRITVLVQDQKNWGVDTFICMDVTVVGVTGYGSHLYFHKDLGRMMLAGARADTNMIYMPIPEEGSMLGREVTRYNGVITYKCISNGSVATDDILADRARTQAAELIREDIERMDSFFEEITDPNYFKKYSFGQPKIALYSDMTVLSYYAGRWGIQAWNEEGSLIDLMEGLGVDDSWRDLYYSEQQAWFEKLFTPEKVEILREAAEPLIAQVRAAYEKDKADFLALDLSRLSLDEVKDLAQQWGEPLNVHLIQPGEAVVSNIVFDSIAQSWSDKASQSGAPAAEESDFLTSAFDNMGERKNIDLSQIADEKERAAAREKMSKELTVLGTTDVGNYQVVLLHPEDFEELTYPGKGDQISVFVEDYAYVDRALHAIRALGYGAISPYQEGAVTQNEEMAEQRMQTLRVCLIALLAVIVLQILLLRAMFSMETESYRLLSHIGLDCATARHSVLWQVMLFALGGQVLGVGLIMACAARGMDQVVHILHYLPPSYRAALCAIHLCASAFTAVWTMNALKKQVFPESGAQPDLDWDDLGEEVEA